MRGPARRLRVAGLLAGLALAACKSSQVPEDNRRRLEAALWSPDASAVAQVRRLEAVLVDTDAAPEDFALQRFYAAYLLAQVHARAAVDGPFLAEQSTSGDRIGAIGRRAAGSSAERPSPTAHLVAAEHWAAVGRALFDRAARSGPEHDGVTLLPDALWRIDLNDADANLQIVQTLAFARFSFTDEVARILGQSPRLVELASCLEDLERYAIPAELRPWVLAMVFDYLKTRNEPEAYRFGVVAVEGGERFGHALPPERVDAIDRWIVEGSSFVFVCPQSHTAYVPGLRASPVSGVPHLEYVPVERPR